MSIADRLLPQLGQNPRWALPSNVSNQVGSIPLVQVTSSGAKVERVRLPWCGSGIAHRIHEELLPGRQEERATLLVDPRNGSAKRLYESWGYEHNGDQKPFPDSPLYATLVRQLKAA
jgi:hypothetical protein